MGLKPAPNICMVSPQILIAFNVYFLIFLLLSRCIFRKFRSVWYIVCSQLLGTSETVETVTKSKAVSSMSSLSTCAQENLNNIGILNNVPKFSLKI